MALPHSADDCTLPTSDPEELLTTVCPARRDKAPEDMAAALSLLTTERDERGHTLLEYAPDGRLRYPPEPYYRHQSYINDAKRCPSSPTSVPATAAQNSGPSSNAPAPAPAAGTAAPHPHQQTSAETSAPFTIPAPLTFSSSPSPSPSPSLRSVNVALPPPRAPARRGGPP